MTSTLVRVVHGIGRVVLLLCLVAAVYALYNVLDRATLPATVSDHDVVVAAASATMAAARATNVAGAVVATCGTQVMSPGDICYECSVTVGGSGSGTQPGSPFGSPCPPDQVITTYTYDEALARATSQQASAEDRAELAAEQSQVAYYKAVQAQQQAQAEHTARRAHDAAVAPVAGIAAATLGLIGALILLYARVLLTVPKPARWTPVRGRGRSAATPRLPVRGATAHLLSGSGALADGESKTRRHALLVVATSVLTLGLIVGAIAAWSHYEFSAIQAIAFSITPTPSATPTPAPTQTPAPAAAEQPLVSDPLTVDTGMWTVRAPGCQFAQGGYQVSTAVCLSNLIEEDGAVAVDVRLLPSTASPSASAAYGITVRHAAKGASYTNPNDGYEFALDAQGRWGHINNFEGAVTSAFFPNAAIRGGPQATNALLICFAAGHYDFYVNGEHVGADTDPSVIRGAIGLSAVDLSGKRPLTAVFSNFAFYFACPK